MAKMTFEGFDAIEAQLGKLERQTIRRLVEAGANAEVQEMRGNIQAARHIRTGSMLANVRPGEYHEFLGGGEINVYPQGNDGKGTPNALKAFVINYGRGKRKRGTRMGDHFITGKVDQAEIAVSRAMQEEADRIIDKINR